MLNRQLECNRDDFLKWKRKCNQACWAISGLSCDDIPDWDYWSAFASGMGPEESAREALEEAGFPGEE